MQIIDQNDHYTIIDCGFRKYKFYHYNLDKFLKDEVKNIYLIADDKNDANHIISILAFDQYYKNIWQWSRLDLDNEALNAEYHEIYNEFEPYAYYHFLIHDLNIDKRYVYGSKLDEIVNVIDFSNNALIVIEPISIMDSLKLLKLPDFSYWFNCKYHSRIKNGLRIVKRLIQKDKEE